MNVLIRQQDGTWACKVDGVDFVLTVPVKVKLVQLVRAILRQHPEAIIELDDYLGGNPFVKYSVTHSRSLGLSYDLNGISVALAHDTDPMVCMRCGGKAWWDPQNNSYHCEKCGAMRMPVSRLRWTPEAKMPGWLDENAASPKPVAPCKYCGKNDPGWHKYDERWICRACGHNLPLVKDATIPF